MTGRCVVILSAIGLLTGACGQNETGTSPSETSTSSANTQRFDAILNPRASAFFSFQVGGNGGAVSINLASLSPIYRPGALPIAVDIGYGVPVGEGCELRKSVQTAPGLTSQLTDSLTIGIYCASITDLGNLTEPVNFSMRITHP